MKTRDIVVFVGSLRADSINKRLARALEKGMPAHFALHYADLDVPLFNQDREQTPPAGVATIKQQIERAHGLLFVTPEHNRSVPAALKNILDWGSRPQGQSVWAGKAAGLLGTSPGAAGTGLAQQHLRNILASLGVNALTTPEVFLQMKPDLINEQGDISDPRTQAFLQGWIERYSDWIERLNA